MSRHAGKLERLGALLQRDSMLRGSTEIESSPVSFRDWEAAVGSRIAARARPVKLDRGVLHVRAASSTWAQELSLLGDTIAAQLRARGVAVQSLRFRVGKVDPVERPPWRDEVRTAPPEVPLPSNLRQEIGRVADPELRSAIAKAAAINLGWQAAEASARARAQAGTPPMRVAPAGRTPPLAREEEATPAPRAKRLAAETALAARAAGPEAKPAARAAGPEAKPAARAAGPEAKPAATHARSTGAEPAPTTSPRRGARDPRADTSGSARSGRTKAPSGGGRPGTT